MKKYEFLKKIRLDSGLSRAKMSKIVDVPAITIDRYENNKTDFNASTKYIQGISALYEYNPEIFNNEDITSKLLENYEFAKFTKAIRKYLYFSGYGVGLINFNQFVIDSFNINRDEDILFLLKEILYEPRLTNNYLDRKYRDKTFLEMLIILAINRFKPSEFGNIDEYINIISYKDEFFKKWRVFQKSKFYKFSQKEFEDKLLYLEEKGLELSIENISLISKELKIKKLQNDIKNLKKELSETKIDIFEAEIIDMNSKDYQICELLKYAPDTFKDKIIQKLKTYKEDIESL